MENKMCSDRMYSNVTIETKDAIETKFHRAKWQLLRDHRFLADLVLKFQFIEKKDLPRPTMKMKITMANGIINRVIYYDPEFVVSCTEEQLKGEIAHELMHFVFRHHIEWMRKKNRVMPIYSLACEYIVNHAVVNLFNLSLNPNYPPVIAKKYFNKYTEEVYEDLMKEFKISPGLSLLSVPEQENALPGELHDLLKQIRDNHNLNFHNDESNTLLTELDMQTLELAAKMDITRAWQTARVHGKYPAGLDRIIGELLESKTPWQNILAEFITQHSHRELNWKQPSRRFLWKNLYLPSRRSEFLIIGIAIDASGSISKAELTEFISQVSIILTLFPDYLIYLMSFDTELTSFQEVLNIDETDLFQLTEGGGGTSFIPIFDKIQNDNLDIQALLVFTDTFGTFPDTLPYYPVLWVVKSQIENVEVPFGTIVRFE